jgi:hypothetical protein
MVSITAEFLYFYSNRGQQGFQWKLSKEEMDRDKSSNKFETVVDNFWVKSLDSTDR